MDSVWAGLKELPEEGRVAIHDGVRPFITPRLIDQGFKYLNRHRAVVYGRKIRETIKEVVGGRVVRTIERERLYSIQTPQFFEIGLIRRAYEVARGDRFEGPDDASLVERIGEEVRVILGPIVNFKITSPEDLNLAKLLIRGQR
jgi:2-C-methyl-D-erythritol 4-phosphate cytidylyltransferase